MTEDIFDIPGDVVAQAEESQSFKLAVPENARRHRKEPNTFFWMECGIITAASSSSYLNEKVNQTVTTMQFTTEINAEGSGLNANRVLTTTLRINKTALKTGEPKSQHTMSLMSVAKLKSLLNSLGISPDLDGGGYSKALLDAHFPKESEQFPGESSPLVAQTIYFEVKQSDRELPDGTIKAQAEINKILAMPKA